MSGIGGLQSSGGFIYRSKIRHTLKVEKYTTTQSAAKANLSTHFSEDLKLPGTCGYERTISARNSMQGGGRVSGPGGGKLVLRLHQDKRPDGGHCELLCDH